MRTQVLRITGKAKDVFPALSLMARKYGDLTLAEIIKEKERK